MDVVTSWNLISSSVKIGKAVLDENARKDLKTKLKLIFRSNRKIAVLGISGSGKSQFLNSICQTLEIPERTLTTDNIRYDLEDYPLVFFDTPGHKERQSDRKKILASVIRGEIDGIINVVSYGYEENPKVLLNDIFDSNNKVKDSFLNINRKSELDRLSEWLPFIETSNVKWIINLVNKADLWWDRHEEVNLYYENGTFCNAIKGINNTINVITLPYCSIIKPYFDVSTCGKFGELNKQNLQNNLTHQLLNLLNEKK